MQRSGTSAPAVHDDGQLRDVMQRPGPVVTLWANRPEPIPRAIASRVRRARDEIHELLPDHVVTAVEQSLEDAFEHAPGIVLVAADDGIRFVERVDEQLHHERVLFGELAALAPVIEHRQSRVPFVLAMIDRRGADYYWAAAGEQGAGTVAGDDTFITKVQAGGWSHQRYQQRAENTWDHNAAEIAAELERLARATSARLMIIASEERMGQLLRTHLPPEVAELIRDVPGSRTADGSDDEREAQVRRWVRTAVAEDTVAALQLFDEERGQLDRAANGAAATFEALRASRVDTLLLHDDGAQQQTAFFAEDEVGLVALDRQTFDDLGRRPAGPARMHDVAIRACLLTGASVRVVPAHSSLDEGIGAILRW